MLLSKMKRTFKKVLGASERVVRKALSQAMTPDLIRDHGVHEAAVFQQLHHSRAVHEQTYVRGLRNFLNTLQAALLHWE